jgi:hypothetical protein
VKKAKLFLFVGLLNRVTGSTSIFEVDPVV